MIEVDEKEYKHNETKILTFQIDTGGMLVKSISDFL
jgi:hypothetical protein